ncbi:MAG TPA: efflux RND transporter periplasmic adaptor subunit [Longimicrobiales bacterium]|nr:efflux RND transporter periplasmic adaptor subunit [Longimicrobiales bacterium]
MRTRRLAIVTVAGLAAACGQAGGAQVDGDSTQARLRTINVEVVEVTPEAFTDYVRVVGTVEAERDVTVSAEETGVVEAVLARKGERVRPGQPLLRLDAGVLRAQLAQAAAQAALADETWARQKRLWEEEKVGTEMSYLQARYNAETARAQARVLAERLQRTTVRAPIGGILDDRMVDVGNMVVPGTPVARVLDLDTIKVVGGVPERYAADIARGARVGVIVDALGGREFVGQVDFVGSAVAGDNRTFAIEVEVANPGMGIKPGMSANVQIFRIGLEDALVVPRHAVIRREEGYVVYVAKRTADGWRAEARGVLPGLTRGERVVITAGLEPGDRVVVVGQQRLAHGDALIVTNEAELGGAAVRPDTAAAAGEESER